MAIQTVQEQIDRHESLWLNGELKRTRHKNWEMYMLIDPDYPKPSWFYEQYIVNSENGGWTKCSKPRGNRFGGSCTKAVHKDFEGLRQEMIAQFPAHRKMLKDQESRTVHMGAGNFMDLIE